MRLGREPGLVRERESAHQRRRLQADRGQQDLRPRRWPVQMDQVLIVVHRHQHVGGQQRAAQQIEARRQIAVVGGDETQPQPALSDVESLATAFALQEHGRMIDERPQHPEQLRRRERLAPADAGPREPVVEGLDHPAIDGGQILTLRQLEPAQL